jgi:hypothetical protein
MAFTGLSNITSRHLVVQVQVKATSDSQQLRMFEGKNSQVTAQNVFNQSLPECSTTPR